MPEYIERESAKQVFASQNKSLQAACYSIIDSISAADVAQVVRCKDCTFWTPKPGTWKSWGACSKVAERYTEDSESSMDCDTNYNDFCSYGERKDGDSNDE